MIKGIEDIYKKFLEKYKNHKKAISIKNVQDAKQKNSVYRIIKGFI